MSENNWPSRRSVLKGVGSAVAVAGLNTTITAANPSTVGLDSDKGRVENRRRVTFGEDLQRVSDYWMMIAGPSERIYNYIAAAELPKSERSRLKGLYKGIDRRFPVVRQSVGENAIKVALAERAAEPEDAGGNVEKLPEIATAVNNGETTLTDGPDVGPLWNPNLHNDMVGFAAEKVSVSDTYTGKLKNKSWAGDPDNFDREIPDSLKDVLSVDKKKYLREVVQSWRHYRNPSASAITDPSVPRNVITPTGQGVAHVRTEEEFNTAVETYDSGDKDDAYKHLAYASHYSSDCANPLHTGMELEQASDYVAANNKSNALHYRFEDYMANNWEDFKSAMDNGYHYGLDDPRKGVNDLATTSNKDASTIFYDIKFKSESEWKDSLESVTRDRIAALGLYMKGMVIKMEN
jgi:hypothetical protein